MHARVFSYGFDRRADGATVVLSDLGTALARQRGYRGRIVVAAGNRLLDVQLHDCQSSAIRAWALVECVLTGPHLTAAIQLVGEGAVLPCWGDRLRAQELCGAYARVAAPHYPPGDLPDGERWSAILRAQPGYCGWMTIDAGYGRLLTLTAYDAAASYCAARDGAAAQQYIATELAPRWTAPTQHLGAGAILVADFRD